jgi:hypothetical protein
MKRRLLTILCALSLLLFVAVVVLWLRSYWRDDRLSRRSWRDNATRYLNIEVRTYPGRAYFACLRSRQELPARHHTAKPVEWLWLSFPVNQADGSSWRYRYWFSFYEARHYQPRDGDRGWSESRLYTVTCPYWTFAVLLAALPAWTFAAASRRKHRERRRHVGLCPSCNYDLRATPDRCPECGAAPASPP